MIEALDRLERNPDVDVIVVARGGGSIEDLLPFSDEALIRAVHAMRTPVVSAIGHEPDQPLLDLVADVRASTPTDAAKLVVPDMAEEVQRRDVGARPAAPGRSRQRIAREQEWLDAAALAAGDGRPAQPARRPLRRARRPARARPSHALAPPRPRRRRHRPPARPGPALSPLATLQRGYAVLQDADGHVVTSVAQAAAGAAVSVRVADGRIHATTDRIEADPSSTRPRRTPMSDATTEQPSYEEAREELIEVVRTLEAGGTTLEESLALWERGEALAKVCQEWLDGARKRLDEAIGRRRRATDALSASASAEVGLEVLDRRRAVDEDGLVADLGGVARGRRRRRTRSARCR